MKIGKNLCSQEARIEFLQGLNKRVQEDKNVKKNRPRINLEKKKKKKKKRNYFK